jgi:DNA polymerase II small subunit/DNA polymerase delta subunit B
MSTFMGLFSKITWIDIIEEPKVNVKFDRFMMKLRRAFDTAFPLRLVPTRKPNAATWVTQGIRNSSKKVRLFNIVKKQVLLSNDTRLYITKYNRIYKRIIKEAKRREINRFLSQASNKAKATWKIINKERVKQLPSKQDITLVTQSIEVSDPNAIADMFNSYFCNEPKKLWDSKK